jgi:hypothetical protein
MILARVFGESTLVFSTWQLPEQANSIAAKYSS